MESLFEKRRTTFHTEERVWKRREAAEGGGGKEEREREREEREGGEESESGSGVYVINVCSGTVLDGT